jgi:hypothetical protein
MRLRLLTLRSVGAKKAEMLIPLFGRTHLAALLDR